MSGNNRTAKQPEYWHSEYDRLAMQSYLSGEDIVFSQFGLHEKQNDSVFNTNTIFTSHDNLNSIRNFPSASFSDTVYFDIASLSNNIYWVNEIKDFVDVESLIIAMKRYDMALPNYVIFKEMPWLYKFLGGSAFTPSLSLDTICIDISFIKEKNELLVVEAIAHEAWHLKKQPLLARKIAGIYYEPKAYDIGNKVMNDYIRIKETKAINEYKKHIK